MYREAVVELEFPGGRLPVKGLQCPSCGNEVVSAGAIERITATARELGLLGIDHARRRKLRRTGTSISVTLDPELLALIAPGAKVGDKVTVGRLGNKIVIERAEG